jgi:hypothetical protein
MEQRLTAKTLWRKATPGKFFKTLRLRSFAVKQFTTHHSPLTKKTLTRLHLQNI